MNGFIFLIQIVFRLRAVFVTVVSASSSEVKAIDTLCYAGYVVGFSDTLCSLFFGPRDPNEAQIILRRIILDANLLSSIIWSFLLVDEEFRGQRGSQRAYRKCCGYENRTQLESTIGSTFSAVVLRNPCMLGKSFVRLLEIMLGI
jgi:hypothetical protein